MPNIQKQKNKDRIFYKVSSVSCHLIVRQYKIGWYRNLS